MSVEITCTVKDYWESCLYEDKLISIINNLNVLYPRGTPIARRKIMILEYQEVTKVKLVRIHE